MGPVAQRLSFQKLAEMEMASHILRRLLERADIVDDGSTEPVMQFKVDKALFDDLMSWGIGTSDESQDDDDETQEERTLFHRRLFRLITGVKDQVDEEDVKLFLQWQF